ncbi:MAG: CHRD domain-containing protein, partial [Anaerolineales bacterium]
AAAADRFDTVMMFAPYDDANRSEMGGRGSATAILDGNKLTIDGTFEGLKSTATKAQLRLGRGIAVPGAVLSELAVKSDTSGSLSGSIILTAGQVRALRAGWLYIQIESVKLSAPYGNLWGWLFPVRGKVADGVVEHGQRFLPQLDLPQK